MFHNISLLKKLFQQNNIVECIFVLYFIFTFISYVNFDLSLVSFFFFNEDNPNFFAFTFGKFLFSLQIWFCEQVFRLSEMIEVLMRFRSLRFSYYIEFYHPHYYIREDIFEKRPRLYLELIQPLSASLAIYLIFIFFFSGQLFSFYNNLQSLIFRFFIRLFSKFKTVIFVMFNIKIYAMFSNLKLYNFLSCFYIFKNLFLLNYLFFTLEFFSKF